MTQADLFDALYMGANCVDHLSFDVRFFTADWEHARYGRGVGVNWMRVLELVDMYHRHCCGECTHLMGYAINGKPIVNMAIVRRNNVG